MRYFSEIPGVGLVYANDFSADAVETIRKTVALNALDPKRVVASHSDARYIVSLSFFLVYLYPR